jgi:hypothetical protein
MPSHSCPKPVGESAACPTAEPSNAQVNESTETLLSTDSLSFCPAESRSVL